VTSVDFFVSMYFHREIPTRLSAISNNSFNLVRDVDDAFALRLSCRDSNRWLPRLSPTSARP